MRKFFGVLALAGAVALGGCGDDDGTGPDGEVTGTYNLETIDGDDLPFTIVQIGNEFKLEILSGFVTLRGDNTFTASGTFRETEGGSSTTVTDTSTGTYTLSGSTLTLNFDDDDENQIAVLSDDRITFTSEGSVFVFEK